MTTRKKHLLSAVAFVLLGIIGLCGATRLLERKHALKKYEYFFNTDVNYDVLFMGTSRSYNTFYPIELWQNYGISSYNWAYNNCTTAENYWLLQDLVRYTDPKVVVCDLNGIMQREEEGVGNGKYQSDRIGQQHVQYDTLPLTQTKIAGVWDVFDDYSGRADFLWDFLMYHNRWSELSKEDFGFEASTQMGATRNLNVLPLQETAYTDEPVEVSGECWDYLIRSLEWCKAQGIEVLCVYVPNPKAVKGKTLPAALDELLAGRDDCTFLDMTEEGILDLSTDYFTDGSHPNYMGGSKLTDWMGQYLRAHYTLPNRSDSEFWRDRAAANLGANKKQLTGSNDLTSYLVQLYNKNFSAQFCIRDPDVWQIPVLHDLLMILGVPEGETGQTVDGFDTQSTAPISILVTDRATGEVADRVSFRFEVDQNVITTEKATHE